MLLKLRSIPNRTEDGTSESTSMEVTTDSATSPTENENIAKYLKMLHFGIPVEAIKTQIKADGLNPQIIEYAFDILTFHSMRILNVSVMCL